MKIIHSSSVQTIALGAMWVILLNITGSPARAGEEIADSDFPYVIQLELGATEFAAGDNIVITSVRGDRKHLESGGRYRVEGSYTLASADRADLALYSTSRGPSSPSPDMDDQHTWIERGSGKFSLKKTLGDDGWLHITFYVDGTSHGGVYFGEKGVEKTILRKKTWSDFSKSSRSATPGRPSDAGDKAGLLANAANLAILTFLGNPVPPPTDLHSNYNQANLKLVFAALARKENLGVKVLELDESEFPFLVYGVLAEECDFRVLEKGLGDMKGYVYAGSVVGLTGRGSTYFALNMTPHDQYPNERCSRRLMIRLQMLADIAQRRE